jgi:hypothetical protein
LRYVTVCGDRIDTKKGAFEMDELRSYASQHAEDFASVRPKSGWIDDAL